MKSPSAAAGQRVRSPNDATQDANGKPLSWLLEGRDEMNLASFPISVSKNHKAARDEKGNLKPIVYRSSYFDPKEKKLIPQTVTISTASKESFPTPADESVLLAIICIAKHRNDFQTQKVSFQLREIFSILGWSSDGGQNYRRLPAALDRLRDVKVRFERAWWDNARRCYLEETITTGVISEFGISRQRRRGNGDNAGKCFLEWTGTFFESLQRGNLKKLDLKLLFSLDSGSKQRAYRYLDKRFNAMRRKNRAARLDVDLREFACAHVGLAPVENIAELKRRVLPIIRDFEKRGIIEKLDAAERFYCVKKGKKSQPGLWRVRLSQPAMPLRDAVRDPGKTKTPAAQATESPAEHLVRHFHLLWRKNNSHAPQKKELEAATKLVAEHGLERAKELVPVACKVLRMRWPDAATFLAVITYLPEILKASQRGKQQKSDEGDEKIVARVEVPKEAVESAMAAWEEYGESKREALWQEIRGEYPDRDHIENKINTDTREKLIADRCIRYLATTLKSRTGISKQRNLGI